MRYFFHIGYHGSRYNGWQKHPGVVTVQGVLEIALSQILKTTVPIVGCGRTDALVHASQFFFHIDVEQEWAFDLLFRLNKLLPTDIAVFDIIPMQGLPHARFDATARTYDYFIHTRKDPFLNNFSAYYPEKELDFEKMIEATALLTKYNDYRAFCKMPDRIDHTICNITAAAIFINKAGNKLRFQISANRFLSKMVRMIIGRLLEIGRGDLSVEQFEFYLATQQTPAVIIPAYPQGLYLSKVTYPYLDLQPSSSFVGMLKHTVDEF